MMFTCGLSTWGAPTEELLLEDDVMVSNQHQLVVYNDDYNTFEWVIECFVKILNHTEVQSEQLAIMIHYRGKAVVKTADLITLRPFKDALCDCGLSAVIESESKANR
jgi:ATP-dependent Clp protease adaptor protein ClpS